MKKEKTYNLLLFILMFLVILSMILIKPLGNLDELWNYNFARNIADGRVPYKDFNMLQMPLLPIICGIILKVISNELIVMRILAALLCSVVFYITYKIFNILNIKKEITIIFTFIIGYLFVDLFCIDYNFATLLLVLIIIFNEIKFYKEDNNFLKSNLKIDIFLGILAGLTVTLKQTTGLFVCVALLGNKLLFVRNKEEIKIYFKIFIWRLVGILITVTIMLIYLYLSDAFFDFINYTILGVSGFSNYIDYTSLVKPNVIGILSILVPLIFIYEWIKTIIFEKDKIEYIFLVYGLAMFVVCFPISDEIHFLIGALPTIVLIFDKIYNVCFKIFNKFLKQNDKVFIIGFINFIYAFFILIVLCSSFIFFYKYFKQTKHSNLDHYKYIVIGEDFENEIKKVSEYIRCSEKKVKILDATSAIYMIPSNRYNKNYDMLLKGNLGKDGESILMKEIEEYKNIQYLILNDNFYKNWQTPMDVINFTIKNKTKVGEIEIFDIYE